MEKVGFEGVRPYALRHTFATINLARGENIKTISVILGHASPSYTLDLYVGYIPSTSRELSNRYVSRLESLPQAHSFGTFVFRCVLLGMRYNSSAAFSQRMNCGRRQVVRPRLPKLLHYSVRFLLKSLSDLVRFEYRFPFYQAHGMKNGKSRFIFI